MKRQSFASMCLAACGALLIPGVLHAEVEILWTTKGYRLFDADAYLDAFLEKKIDLVPWGFPCVRIEGGAYTGKGTPSDSCEVDVPGGVNITNRRFVVDEVVGSVVVYCTFGAGGPDGGSGAPDTHLLQSSFRGNAAPPGTARP